jgi:hypothetical protein
MGTRRRCKPITPAIEPVQSSRHISSVWGWAEMGRYQEQIQMIATAIGKPTASVLTNVRANSESKFGSGRVCSNDMRLAPSLQIEKGRQKK